MIDMKGRPLKVANYSLENVARNVADNEQRHFLLCTLKSSRESLSAVAVFSSWENGKKNWDVITCHLAHFAQSQIAVNIAPLLNRLSFVCTVLKSDTFKPFSSQFFNAHTSNFVRFCHNLRHSSRGHGLVLSLFFKIGLLRGSVLA